MNESDSFQTRASSDQELDVTVSWPGGTPKQIGRYRIVSVLGKGGFGLVYLAQDDQLNRPVAIKVPHPSRMASPEDVQAYLTEARTVAGLDHPHIVPVFDIGSTDECPCFFVSKYIEGTTLANKIDSGHVSVAEAAEITATVAEALHYAHSKGLVHRDVKPGNILLDTAGRPFVADFGLALKEEDVGSGHGFAGTLPYMSPEQARGEGHRVDGRSDIFSLGAVFYELLTGRRLFKAESQQEILDQIIHIETKPPRQIKDDIPQELERICLKALSKRASERYTTAKDLADDLRHFLTNASQALRASISVRQTPEVAAFSTASAAPPPSSTASMTTLTLTSDARPIKIVPKGLRSFDAHDADFFLELLPGPRDRDGLPDGIRYWKSHIEELDADKTFAVGLIYGPSGCGKSSMVKAGLLPHLSKNVLAHYIEANAEDTETRLLKALTKTFPNLPAESGVVEMLASLRRGRGLAGDKKVLIIIDQFEQWLHAKRTEENAQLVQALRQCDGGRVQCIVMVRDDFWMAATRFMSDLEIRLLEGENSAAVDLFPERHAKKVLAAFGRAFGTLPEAAGIITKEQRNFLDQAVAGLAQEGKVVCVRLALFAEMVKGKPWSPATLRDVGGTEGVGVTFLEETFVASTAPPQHRLHQRAAQAVLKALLPASGTDIKGNMRSEAELLEASGYAARPNDFKDLIRMLDGELRLITPTDHEGHESEDLRGSGKVGVRYYQFTHDYLVPSLRDWLTHKQKETHRGRMELRLAERAAGWVAKKENRHLPSWWEWANIRLFTDKKQWTDTQRQYMRKANGYHAVRGAVLAALLVIAAAAGLWIRADIVDDRKATFAAGLVHRLLDAQAAQTPTIIADMGPYRRWVNPLLKEQLDDPAIELRRKIRASLGLLPVDPGQRDFLFEQLLDADPQMVPVIRDALAPHRQELIEKLWTAVEHPSKDIQRPRAAAALAAYDPQSARWEKNVRPIAEQVVVENPLYLGLWMDALRPVKSKLIDALGVVFRDRADERTAERSLATIILADFAAGQPEALADLLVDADEKQFAALFPKMLEHGDRSVLLLMGELDKQPDASEEGKERLAKRQANAAAALVKMNQPAKVWPQLAHKADPRMRSYLIHRLALLKTDPKLALKRFGEETDNSIRRALLLALGAFSDKDFSSADKITFVPQLLALYKDDADPGLHAAAEWLLRQWGHQEDIKKITDALATGTVDGKRRWYVTGQGQTMVVFPAPPEFWMGSPSNEADREISASGDVERKHLRRIDRTFALAAKEVTLAEFLRFQKDHKYQTSTAPTPECPVNSVSWYKAAEYCNWLSKMEKIPPEQWCFEPNAMGQYAEGMKVKPNYLELSGYRLATEAEWEFACRAGAVSSRFFGESEELLAKYACYYKNSLDRAMFPVGNLKPNDFGLFDMQGNAMEWCQELSDAYPASDGNKAVLDREDKQTLVKNQQRRVLRGGAFTYRPGFVRSAQRGRGEPQIPYPYAGFRVARTIARE